MTEPNITRWKEGLNLNMIDPGVRELVRLLRAAGFNTCDSGDGSKAKDMECAVPYPMVAIQVEKKYFFQELDRLGAFMARQGYPDWTVEGNASPLGPALLVCYDYPSEGL